MPKVRAARSSDNPVLRPPREEWKRDAKSRAKLHGSSQRNVTTACSARAPTRTSSLASAGEQRTALESRVFKACWIFKGSANTVGAGLSTFNSRFTRLLAANGRLAKTALS